jgi:hypothetical protein
MGQKFPASVLTIVGHAEYEGGNMGSRKNKNRRRVQVKNLWGCIQKLENETLEMKVLQKVERTGDYQVVIE